MSKMKTTSNVPEKPFAQCILAHGAGANKDSEFMQAMANRLCQRGVKVIRFDFPYMIAAQEKQKRQPPNRMPILVNDFEEMIKAADKDLPLFIGGKSMGGRVATMLPNYESVKGIICLGYPFHPPGKPEKHRTAHLQDFEVDTLIVQGERDTFGNRERVGNYQLSSTIHVEFLASADHSFVALKSSGISVDQHLDTTTDLIVNFMQRQL